MKLLGKDERDMVIPALILSNLVGFGLGVENIDKIKAEMTKDILDVLSEFDALNEKELEEEEPFDVD